MITALHALVHADDPERARDDPPAITL